MAKIVYKNIRIPTSILEDLGELARRKGFIYATTERVNLSMVIRYCIRKVLEEELEREIE